MGGKPKVKKLHKRTLNRQRARWNMTHRTSLFSRPVKDQKVPPPVAPSWFPRLRGRSSHLMAGKAREVHLEVVHADGHLFIQEPHVQKNQQSRQNSHTREAFFAREAAATIFRGTANQTNQTRAPRHKPRYSNGNGNNAVPEGRKQAQRRQAQQRHC